MNDLSFDALVRKLLEACQYLPDVENVTERYFKLRNRNVSPFFTIFNNNEIDQPEVIRGFNVEGIVYTKLVDDVDFFSFRSWEIASDAFLLSLARKWISPDPAVLLLRPDQITHVGRNRLPALTSGRKDILQKLGIQYEFMATKAMRGDTRLSTDIIWHSPVTVCALVFPNENDRINAQIAL